jgi:L-fuculose-phosphate aldolase
MISAEDRRAIVAMAHRLAERGWVANHDGNVSCRAGEGRLLATPTAVGKAEVTPELILLLDGDGKLVTGRGKPFSEIGLHLTVYRARPDVQAVLHAHPPTATGLCVANSRLLAQPFLYEAVVSLGPGVPLVPSAMPGRTAEDALRPYLGEHDAVLLGNHGVLTWGPDLLTAFHRMELVEHLARIALVAVQAGGIKALPESELGPLLEARKKAGLGAAGRGAVVATPPAATVIPAPSPDLARIISQEVARALGRGQG